MSEHHAIARAERRLYPRYSVQLPVDLQPEGASAPLALETSDLSLCGCSVMVADQLTLGLSVRLTLTLNDESITIKGRVITRHPHFGNGIMFLKFDADGEERLRIFLETLKP